MNYPDKKTVLEILTSAFYESDRLKAILRNGKTNKRLRIMANYAYNLTKKLDGIYLSEDKSTVIVYWQNSKYRRSLMDSLSYFIVFIRTMQLRKIFETLKREKIVKNKRSGHDDYIYVWLLGKKPEVKSVRGLADVRDHLFKMSKELKLPILIETTVEKILKLYKYIGFEIYDELFDDSIGMPVYFMKKETVIN